MASDNIASNSYAGTIGSDTWKQTPGHGHATENDREINNSGSGFPGLGNELYPNIIPGVGSAGRTD